jgi:hypothetical protein
MSQMVGTTLHTIRIFQAFPLHNTIATTAGTPATTAGTPATTAGTPATTAGTPATTMDAEVIPVITLLGTFPKGPHMENISQWVEQSK